MQRVSNTILPPFRFYFDVIFDIDLNAQLLGAQASLRDLRAADPLDMLQIEDIPAKDLVEQLEARLGALLDRAKERKNKLQQNEIEELSNMLKCPICQDEKKNTSLDPCGHVLCKRCAGTILKDMKACPLCRQEVKGAHNVYL